MKTLVVATDFSKTATNAVNYAAQLTKQLKGTLVVFHAYTVPVIMAESMVAMPTLDELEKDGIKRLKRLCTGLKTKYGTTLKVSYECRCGFAVDELKKYVKETNASLLLTGLQGSGYLNDHLIGSVTTALIKKSPCPVLTIGPKEKYVHPKKIVFAYDLKDITNKQLLEPLKDLVSTLSSKLLILNVFKPGHAVPSISEAAAGLEVDRLLGAIKHSFNYVEHQDVVEAVNEFALKQKAHLIVMLPRTHSFFSALVSGSQTKRMAYRSQLPLLTLHD